MTHGDPLDPYREMEQALMVAAKQLGRRGDQVYESVLKRHELFTAEDVKTPKDAKALVADLHAAHQGTIAMRGEAA